MVKLTTRSFRKSRELLTESPSDTPPTPSTPLSRVSDGGLPPRDLSDERDSSDNETDRQDEIGWLEGPCTLHHDCKLVTVIDAPINIDELFTLIFTNSKFYIDTIITQKNIVEYDITGEWMTDPETNLKTRQITFTIPLSGLGPKEARVTETQIMNKCSKPGARYSVDVWAENAGVPYADSFNVLVHSCMERLTDKSSRLTMYGAVKYKKDVWSMVKNIIERGTMPSLDSHGRLLEKGLMAYCELQGGQRPQRMRRRNTLSRINMKPSRAPAARGVGRPSFAAAATIPRMGWTLAMLALLVAINAQLFFILRREERSPCLLNMDGWRERLVDGDEGNMEEMEEWVELLEQFSMKQRGQLMGIKHVLNGEIEALKKTEQSITTMIDKLKPTEKSRRNTRRRLRLTDY